MELIRQPSVDDARDRRILSADVWALRDSKLICEHLDELEMICRYARSAELPQIIRFAVETGMRRGEITDLMRANVDLKKRTAILPVTKNGSARGVPLSSLAVEIVTSQPTLAKLMRKDLPCNYKIKAFLKRKSSNRSTMIRSC